MTSTVNHTLPRRMSTRPTPPPQTAYPAPPAATTESDTGYTETRTNTATPPREPHSRARHNRPPRRTASPTHETSRTDRRRKNHAPLRPTTRQRLAQRDDTDKTDDNANSITTRHHDEQATPITTRRQERRTTRDARRDNHSKTPSETTR